MEAFRDYPAVVVQLFEAEGVHSMYAENGGSMVGVQGQGKEAQVGPNSTDPLEPQTEY